MDRTRGGGSTSPIIMVGQSMWGGDESASLTRSGEAMLWEVRREGGAYIRTILRSIGERSLNLLQQEDLLSTAEFNLMNCLPYEVCLYIFSFLDPRSILAAAKVCTSWNVIASDLSLWKHLYEHSLSVAIARHHPHLHPPHFADPDELFSSASSSGPSSSSTCSSSSSSSTSTSTSSSTSMALPWSPLAPLADLPPSSPPSAASLSSFASTPLFSSTSTSSPSSPPVGRAFSRPSSPAAADGATSSAAATKDDDGEAEDCGVGNTIFADEKEIRSGSLGRLVERLVAEKPPESYVSVFLMTYRTFTTPAVLLTTLLALYQRADGSPGAGGPEDVTATWFPFPPHSGERSIITLEEEADIRALKFRICNVLKLWMDEYFVEDFKQQPQPQQQQASSQVGDSPLEPLFPMLITFVLGKLIREGRDTLANILKTSLYNQFHTKQLAAKLKRLSSSDMMDAVSLSPPKPKLGKISLASPRLALTDISEEEAARQLTLIEHALICKLKAHELLNARGKTDVMNAVNYCNRLSLWVVATILHEETPRARAKMKARFVAIALHLRNLNNFNGMLTVVGALESPAVSRLAETNAELKRKRNSVIKVERELLALAQTAREINKEMLSVPKLPGIPSLAMCLSQLSLINNVHSDTFEGLVNFVKRQLYCTEVLFPFREYQKATYNLVPVLEIQSFLLRGVNAPHNESDLYALSLALEPSTRED